MHFAGHSADYHRCPGRVEQECKHDKTNYGGDAGFLVRVEKFSVRNIQASVDVELFEVIFIGIFGGYEHTDARTKRICHLFTTQLRWPQKGVSWNCYITVNQYC